MGQQLQQRRINQKFKKSANDEWPCRAGILSITTAQNGIGGTDPKSRNSDRVLPTPLVVINIVSEVTAETLFFENQYQPEFRRK